MTTHTVNINGIDLVYDKEGAGPALVFIHGGNASAVYWEAIVPHFMGDYTCYLLDLRGHGRSGRPANHGYAPGDFVADVERFIDEVSGPAVIVGWSLGALIAMMLAASRPGLVKAIYSEDAVPQAVTGNRVPPVASFLAALGSLARLRDSQSLSVAAHAHNIGKLPAPGGRVIDVWPPPLLAMFARFTFGTAPEYYDTMLDHPLSEEDGARICRGICCPVHIAVADAALGGVLPDDVMSEFAATGISYTSTRFGGAGHSLSWAFPREFIDDLKAFLATLPVEVAA